ncbi:MAG: hypothetical protein WB217_16960 [Mesobacillus sp.]|uniref:hypothetical protein n=1 Tax=Mesobacillus sp. TaxID=2675271 RepID=UPI003C3C1F7F
MSSCSGQPLGSLAVRLWRQSCLLAGRLMPVGLAQDVLASTLPQEVAFLVDVQF